MKLFQEIIAPEPGLRIVDLGGLPDFWEGNPTPLDITIVNLPGGFGPDAANKAPMEAASGPKITIVTGDACDLPQYEDKKFDLVFSNSVIEHVGPEHRQRAFALQARRLGISYWIQTPSIWFPIEAHNGMPFWWFYPEKLRNWFRDRWRKKLPAWTDMIDGTTVIEKREFEEMFPEAEILTERFMGIPKSYIAVYNGKAASDAGSRP